MNPFCPYDKRLLQQTRECWVCKYCGQKWKKGTVIMKNAELDPLHFAWRWLFG